MRAFLSPSHHLLSLLLFLVTLALALLVPPAAAGRGFGVSARASAHTAIPKRLLREEATAERKEDEEPPPPSFLEEVCAGDVGALWRPVESMKRIGLGGA